MNPGSDQTPASVHGEIARGPDRRRADIRREDGVFRCLLAEQPREVLRVDRLVPGRAAREVVEPGAGLLVMSQALVEMLPTALCLELRQQRLDRGADIPHDAEI